MYALFLKKECTSTSLSARMYVRASTAFLLTCVIPRILRLHKCHKSVQTVGGFDADVIGVCSHSSRTETNWVGGWQRQLKVTSSGGGGGSGGLDPRLKSEECGSYAACFQIRVSVGQMLPCQASTEWLLLLCLLYPCPPFRIQPFFHQEKRRKKTKQNIKYSNR